MQYLTLIDKHIIFETQQYFNDHYAQTLSNEFYEPCKKLVLSALPDLDNRKKLAVYGQIHRELTNLAIQGFGKCAHTIKIKIA